MPMCCSAISCNSTLNINKENISEIKKITFHRFRSNPEKRAKWIEIMKLQGKFINSNSRLCSSHFEEKYIDRTSLSCVRLRENVIPHVQLLQKKVQRKNKKIVALNIDLNILKRKNLTCNKTINTTPFLYDMKKSTGDRQTNISPTMLWKSLTKCAIRDEYKKKINVLKKEIYNLRRKFKLKEKKTETLNSVLSEIKQRKFINEEQYENVT